MSLDGIFLKHLTSEIKDKLVNTKIDKIYQPNKDELVLSFRSRTEYYKLLLSSRANGPRIHLTNERIENPKQPPMFCMLLRKHLSSGKLIQINQHELDRVIELDFSTYNELGDLVILKIIVEIMGKHSNIIFTNADYKILDAIKRVDEFTSSERLILPGLQYRLPPKQNKLNILDYDVSRLLNLIFEKHNNYDLSNSCMQVIQGISPVVSREIQFRTENGEALEDILVKLKNTVSSVSGKPYLLFNIKTKKPFEYSFIPINQYGLMMETKLFPSFSELLDRYYAEKDRLERMKVKSQNLTKTINNAYERVSRKLNQQNLELKQCENRDKYKVYGDLINANLYRIQKGISTVALENYYDNNTMLKIDLDPLRTPAQNAQYYYKKYQKAKVAEEKLKEQIEYGNNDLEYLDSVKDILSRAATEKELSEIRIELQEQGYLNKTKNGKKSHKPKEYPPLEYITSDGFKVLVGRNNKQNDKLTLKTARKNDLWLHVKNHPGSHTVIISDQKEISDTAILEAAQIAAYHSRCQKSENVAVDYTKIRNVNKPKSARPGMVIYVDYKTIYVNPSISNINKEGE